MIFIIFCMFSCQHRVIEKTAPQINDVITGEKFRINLPEDHSTGYMWQLSESYDTGMIQRIGDVWHGNEKGLDMNLKALSPGVTTLTVVKRKYTDTSEVRSYIVRIADN